MKLIKTEDAVGQVLCHDITQIIKGVTKDAVGYYGLTDKVAVGNVSNMVEILEALTTSAKAITL
jgi:hypothetical protein